jgi:hypothetical protein
VHVEWQGQQLLLRPATVTDRAFIFATWMRSYREQHRDVDYEQYHRCQVRRVERLWDRAHIVCREQAADTIHAWVCGSPGVLHYVYVPPNLRRKKLAETAVRAVCGHAVAFSHQWPFAPVPRGWKHNEFLLEDHA